MSYSIVKYTGDGTTKVFSVPFRYLLKEHVLVTVDGSILLSGANYTWVTPQSIQINAAPPAGSVVQFKRNSPKDHRLVNFADATVLTAPVMNQDADQTFFAMQELIDGTDLTSLLSQLTTYQLSIATAINQVNSIIGTKSSVLLVNASTYTLTAASNDLLIRMNYGSANTVVIPTDASVNISVGSMVAVEMFGIGKTLIVPHAGVTVNTSASLMLRKQGSVCALVKVAANEWTLTGDVDGATISSLVDSVNGKTGAVVIDVPVKSVNGQTGDVLINVPAAPVTSVNGQTGAVVISVPAPAAAAVTSVNGQTGDVLVSTSGGSLVAGAVGTYAWLVNMKGVVARFGDTIAGSSLSSNGGSYDPIGMAGVWRSMGDGQANGAISLYLRIS